MISEKMEEALNEQINAELWSAYMYLSMSAYFESENLGGFANWMRVQADEEVEHAMRFYNYVNEVGGRVELKPIDEVPTAWDSPLDAFQETLKHEKKVTSLINDLVDLADEENDHATYSMLQWFVDEQVEEEDSAGEIVEKLEFVGDSANGLLSLDRHLGERSAE